MNPVEEIHRKECALNTNHSDAQQLKDKVAIVTGAGRGLGKSFAVGYARQGADPLLLARNLEQVENTAEKIRSAGGRAVAMQADISDETSVQAVADKVLSLYGRVDVLLNNASLSGVRPRPWRDWTVEQWDTFFTINVRGTWLVCKAIAPLMQQQNRGKIVNVTSDVTFMPNSQSLLPYACSKLAIHQITRSLALALGPSNICVNSIAPGLTATEGVLAIPHAEQIFAGTIDLQCIKRREEPEDLVGAAVFLASDAADFVTGQLLVVNGGAMFA